MRREVEQQRHCADQRHAVVVRVRHHAQPTAAEPRDEHLVVPPVRERAPGRHDRGRGIEEQCRADALRRVERVRHRDEEEEVLGDLEPAVDGDRAVDRPDRRDDRRHAVDREQRASPSHPDRLVAEQPVRRNPRQREGGKHRRQVERLRLREPLRGSQIELRQEEDRGAERDLSELARLPVARGLNEVELSRGAGLQGTLPRPRTAAS